MAKLPAFLKELEKERDRVERQLSGLNAALAAFVGAYTGKTKPTRKRHKISAAGRKRIAAAQRARWAKVKTRKKAT